MTSILGPIDPQHPIFQSDGTPTGSSGSNQGGSSINSANGALTFFDVGVAGGLQIGTPSLSSYFNSIASAKQNLKEVLYDTIGHDVAIAAGLQALIGSSANDIRDVQSNIQASLEAALQTDSSIQATLTTALSNLNAQSTNYSAAVAAYNTAKANLQSATPNLTTAFNNYNSAATALNNVINSNTPLSSYITAVTSYNSYAAARTTIEGTTTGILIPWPLISATDSQINTLLPLTTIPLLTDQNNLPSLPTPDARLPTISLTLATVATSVTASDVALVINTVTSTLLDALRMASSSTFYDPTVDTFGLLQQIIHSGGPITSRNLPGVPLNPQTPLASESAASGLAGMVLGLDNSSVNIVFSTALLKALTMTFAIKLPPGAIDRLNVFLTTLLTQTALQAIGPVLQKLLSEGNLTPADILLVRAALLGEIVTKLGGILDTEALKNAILTAIAASPELAAAFALLSPADKAAFLNNLQAALTVALLQIAVTSLLTLTEGTTLNALIFATATALATTTPLTPEAVAKVIAPFELPPTITPQALVKAITTAGQEASTTSATLTKTLVAAGVPLATAQKIAPSLLPQVKQSFVAPTNALTQATLQVATAFQTVAPDLTNPFGLTPPPYTPIVNAVAEQVAIRGPAAVATPVALQATLVAANVPEEAAAAIVPILLPVLTQALSAPQVALDLASVSTFLGQAFQAAFVAKNGPTEETLITATDLASILFVRRDPEATPLFQRLVEAIRTLVRNDNIVVTTAVAASFREFQKSNIDLGEFIVEHVLDPGAAISLYGLMYQGASGTQFKRGSIDISV